METYCQEAADDFDANGLECALAADLTKLSVHMNKALNSDYPLLGAGELFYCLDRVFY
jgi:hypothetical protein